MEPKITTVLYDRPRDGGDYYEAMIQTSLKSQFELTEHRVRRRSDSPFGCFGYLMEPLRLSLMYRALSRAASPQVVIATFDAALVPGWVPRKHIVIVHHMDYSTNKYTQIYEKLERYIHARLRSAARVVVVSRYWEDYFRQRGFTNIRTIYNAFDADEFSIERREIEEFRKKYGLQGKPIIYLGNSTAHKGGREAFLALNGLNAHFVSTGKVPIEIEGVRTLYLDRREYLKLMRSSAVALTLSQFDEGWCRTAHEAMLCGTPVIGSGRGGMEELLRGGKQLICPRISELRETVQKLLENQDRRKKMGEDGHDFARTFSMERFQSDWVNLILEVNLMTGREDRTNRVGRPSRAQKEEAAVGS